MSADFVTIAGYLLASWVTGYVAGIVIKWFRQVTEKI